MNPLLEQFLSEARDFLQGIGEELMRLEKAPDDAELLVSLFRMVHTLKGNSGLFDFPEMTRVLHAGEDLMDAVRNGRVAFTQELADQLLDAMDFVSLLCDEVASEGHIQASRAADSARLAAALRALIKLNAIPDAQESCEAVFESAASALALQVSPARLPLIDIPEPIRLDAYLQSQDGLVLHWVSYKPIAECFFQGDDPFYAARQTPGILWMRIVPREPWGPLAELDAYRCVLEFQLLTSAPLEELVELYRYVPDQVSMVAVPAGHFAIPQGDPNGGPVYDDFVVDALQHLETGRLDALKQAAQTMLHLSNPTLWFSSALRWLLVLLDCTPQNVQALRRLIESLRTLTAPDWSAELPNDAPQQPVLSAGPPSAMDAIFAMQRQILLFDDQPTWLPGRLKAVASVLINGCKASGDALGQAQVEAALALALAQTSSAPLLVWLDARDNPVAANPVLTIEDAPVIEEEAMDPEPVNTPRYG